MKSKILFLFAVFSILSPMSVMASSAGVACKDWATNGAKERAIASANNAAQQSKATTTTNTTDKTRDAG